MGSESVVGHAQGASKSPSGQGTSGCPAEGEVATVVGEDEDEATLWPALQPSAPLNSLLSAGGRDAGCSQDNSTGQDRDGSSTDRVNRAVGLAFERLWRDRPAVQSQDDATSSGDAGNGCVGTEGSAREDDSKLLLTVDGFITHYFRHVAELSRESVYQAHQREILNRMREDFIAGERSGNMRELDEMIQRVDLDDRTLQTEIASLMRIAEMGQRDGGGHCPDAARCVPTCFGDDEYPPVFDAPLSLMQLPLDSPGAQNAAFVESQANEVAGVCGGSGSSETGGKDVPPCTAGCTVQ